MYLLTEQLYQCLSVNLPVVIICIYLLTNSTTVLLVNIDVYILIIHEFYMLVPVVLTPSIYCFMSNTFSDMSTFLLYSTSTELRRINMDPAAGLDHSDSIIPLTSIGQVIGLDFDAEEDFIYFSDTSRKTISRAKWDGTQERVLCHFSSSLCIPPKKKRKGVVESTTFLYAYLIVIGFEELLSTL